MRPKYMLVVFFNSSTAFYYLPRHPLCLQETLGATIFLTQSNLDQSGTRGILKYCTLTARYLGVFWKYSTLAARYPGIFPKYCTLVARYLGIFSKYSTLGSRYLVEGQRDCMPRKGRVNALQCRLLMRN